MVWASEMFHRLRFGALAASFQRVNSIPPEAQSFAIATAVLAVIAIGLAIRLSITSRSFGLLRQSRNDLEVHLLRAQRDLASARDDAAEWRGQVQQQFEAFRSSIAGQLTMAEARFDRLQSQSDGASKAADKAQLELRTQLEVLRGMCAELPYAKTRILELERGLTTAVPSASMAAEMLLPEQLDELAASADLPLAQVPPPEPEPAAVETAPAALLPLPALVDEPKVNGGTNGHTIKLAEIPTLPAMDDLRIAELETQLADAAQRNVSLQRELITVRSRSAKVAAAASSKAKRSSRA